MGLPHGHGNGDQKDAEGWRDDTGRWKHHLVFRFLRYGRRSSGRRVRRNMLRRSWHLQHGAHRCVIVYFRVCLSVCLFVCLFCNHAVFCICNPLCSGGFSFCLVSCSLHSFVPISCSRIPPPKNELNMISYN